MLFQNMFFEPLESNRTLAGTIDVFQNAIKNPKKVITDLEASTQKNLGAIWRPAKIGIESRLDSSIRSNSILPITDYAVQFGIAELERIHNDFYALLMSASIFYARKYDIGDPMFHESYGALRYQTGEEYKAHYDGSTTTGRFVSAIAYLNDDYDGGELEFPNFGVKIKPREGDLFLFPSNYAYAHIAHPVTSGTKYAIVTWIHDRPVEG